MTHALVGIFVMGVIFAIYPSFRPSPGLTSLVS